MTILAHAYINLNHINMGVDMIEIDVRMSKDGHLIVIHDETVDRTTNGKGEVADLTLNELRKLKLRKNEGGILNLPTEQKIPTLEEALNLAKGRILVNLDIVLENVFDPALAVARQTGTLQQILFKMPLQSLKEEKYQKATFLKDTYFMPIFREGGPPLSVLADEFDIVDPVAYEVVFKTTGYLEEGASSILNQGERFWVNTMWESLSPGYSDDRNLINPDAHWGQLIKLGVNMIQTDRPKELIEYLDSKGMRRK